MLRGAERSCSADWGVMQSHSSAARHGDKRLGCEGWERRAPGRMEPRGVWGVDPGGNQLASQPREWTL